MAQVAWQPQEGPQELFVRCPAFECLYGGALGGGKLLSDATKVVTPFGYRNHGDLRVGDTISAADGTPSKIVLVTERKVHPMYRVVFDDGGEVVAGDDHLWNYSVIGSHKSKTGQDWKTGTTMHMKERIEAGRRIAIPLCSPVKFTKSYKPASNPRKISPYLLGVLLGDGNISGDNVRFSSVDEHIMCRATKGDIGDWVFTKTKDRSAVSCDARGDTRKSLIKALDGLGVYGKLSHEKFVPDPYKWLPVAERFCLLQGLMDTDGFIDERGQAYYTSVSKQLADDVRWLVLSLGGRARITSKIPTFTHNDEKREGQLAYTVTIRMPDNRLIVSLPRKVERANAWRENGHGELKRRIKSIEYVGEEECHCIAIDHPSSLYMVEDFIVTHNTDALLGDYARGIPNGAGWIGVFFRRHISDMDAVIRRSKEIFLPIYGPKCFNSSKNEWRFPNGAMLQFRHMERDDDVDNYQGQDYQWVGFDELTQWATPFQYTYMITRLRSAKGINARIRCASNPGGVGHQWVKARFVDPVPPMTAQQIISPKGKKSYRVFIPAKLSDNKILDKSDPDYADRVSANIDPVLAKALVEGRWDIVAGAAFTEWDPKVHVIDPYPMPTDKKIWRGLDWGFKEPWAAGWFFEYDGDIIMGHEMYGWNGKPNEGSQEPATEVRRKIEDFELLNDIYVPVGLIDGQTLEQRGGDGGLIYDLLGGRDLGWKPWPKGPHSRVQQKQNCHQLLSVVNGSSRFKVMRHCHHFIRTIPSLPTDKKNMEDVNTKAEDHMYDMWRGAMTMKVHSRDELRKRAQRRRNRRNKYVSASDLQYGGS